MKYIAGLLTGVFLGMIGATMYYVFQALNELDDLDVTPEFVDWAKVLPFPTPTTNK